MDSQLFSANVAVSCKQPIERVGCERAENLASRDFKRAVWIPAAVERGARTCPIAIAWRQAAKQIGATCDAEAIGAAVRVKAVASSIRLHKAPQRIIQLATMEEIESSRDKTENPLEFRRESRSLLQEQASKGSEE